MRLPNRLALLSIGLLGLLLASIVITITTNAPQTPGQVPTRTATENDGRLNFADPAAGSARLAPPHQEVVPQDLDKSAQQLRGQSEAHTVCGVANDSTGSGIAAIPIYMVASPELPPVIAENAPPVASTSDLGTFHLESAPSSGWLVVANRDWATLAPFQLEHSLPCPAESRVIVGPCVSYGGIVVDETAVGIRDATVTLQVAGDVDREVRKLAPTSLPACPSVHTDQSGLFLLENVAWSPGCRLVVHADGYKPCELELPGCSHLQIRVLVRDSTTFIAGSVVDSTGVPIADAWLSRGPDFTRSSVDGTFLLALTSPIPGDPLRVAKEGLIPAAVDITEAYNSRGQALAHPVLVTLDALAKSISGRVEGPGGDPIPGAVVWTSTSAIFGVLTSSLPEGFQVATQVNAEALAGGREPVVRADESGRFALKGLVQECYTIHAADTRTMEVVSSVCVPAGSTGVVLRLDPKAEYHRVAGQVVSTAGQPLHGIVVALSRVATGASFYTLIPSTMTDNVITQGDGRFQFGPLCVEGTQLVVYGEPVVGVRRINLAECGDLQNIEIRVGAKCYFLAKLANPGMADGIVLLDSEGHRMQIASERGRGTTVGAFAQFSAGQTDVLSASDQAEFLVAVKRGVEVTRSRVTLIPNGHVQVIDL